MLITLVEIASSSPSTTFSTLLTISILILNLQHHKNTWEVRKKQLWRPRYCCTEQGERGNKSLTRSWINFSWVLFCFSIFSRPKILERLWFLAWTRHARCGVATLTTPKTAATPVASFTVVAQCKDVVCLLYLQSKQLC